MGRRVHYGTRLGSRAEAEIPNLLVATELATGSATRRCGQFCPDLRGSSHLRQGAQQPEAEQSGRDHREQQQAGPTQRGELSASPQDESDQLVARHQAEQQIRPSRLTRSPRDPVLMRAARIAPRSGPKELPTRCRCPTSSFPRTPPPPLPVNQPGAGVHRAARQYAQRSRRAARS
jgi:hypothetical protein